VPRSNPAPAKGRAQGAAQRKPGPTAAPPRLDRRAAGVLCHLTSLPGPHGSGDAGPVAHRFAAHLAAAGQSWWQMLPTGPVDAEGSPYSGFSSVAANPLLISLDLLAREGLLTKADVAPLATKRADRVEHAAVRAFREDRLRRACRAFFDGARPSAELKALRREFDRFTAAHAGWVVDHGLFAAIRAKLGGAPWWQWPVELRDRDPAALAAVRRELEADVRYFEFTQFVFDRQWRQLRLHANGLGVGLIGDVPIFMSHDSADVWCHKELFDLNPDGTAKHISGVPPDYFSKDGQLWGHPLYLWEKHREDGYAWWTQRFSRLFDLFDAVRIDHFLGFNRYWEVSGKAKTARKGQWKPGPRADFFQTVLPKLPSRNIIAEDLGLLTPEAAALRDQFEFPGMRVLQFAFGFDPYHRPHLYPRQCVAYTGTHDNDTTRGWWKTANADERRNTLRYIGGTEKGIDKAIHAEMLRAIYASVANVAVAPLQDLLGLGTEGRMNVPGTTQGNWAWRATEAQAFDAGWADRVRSLAELTERLPPK
jgi:4-alpha-glucanotransferase